MSPVRSVTYVSGLDQDVMVGAEGFEPPTLCSQTRFHPILELAENDRLYLIDIEPFAGRSLKTVEPCCFWMLSPPQNCLQATCPERSPNLALRNYVELISSRIATYEIISTHARNSGAARRRLIRVSGDLEVKALITDRLFTPVRPRHSVFLRSSSHVSAIKSLPKL